MNLFRKAGTDISSETAVRSAKYISTKRVRWGIVFWKSIFSGKSLKSEKSRYIIVPNRKKILRGEVQFLTGGNPAVGETPSEPGVRDLRTPPDRERGCRLIPVRFRNQRYSPDGRGRDPRRPRPARIDADPKKPVWKEFIRARFLFRPENLTRTSRPAKRKGLP